jgi:pimeloyl-ACP methyl ester carboxylesterase
MTAGAVQAPAAVVSRIESLGARQSTPCAGGSMVWRAWGRGAPLVLLHGASGSWTHWIRNVIPLADGRRVLAPDMPGFGDSTAEPASHTADALADLVAQGLDAVVPGPEPFDLAGFSFGGIIAGLVAARLGPRVRALVLLGAGGLGVRTAPMPGLQRAEAGMTAGERAAVHRHNLCALMIADPSRADDLAVFVHTDNVRRARFKSGTIPQSDALERALPDIRAPITAVYGGRDAFVGGFVEDRRRVLASAQPGLDFRVIPGAGHWLVYEASDEVNVTIAGVLHAAGRPL